MRFWRRRGRGKDMANGNVAAEVERLADNPSRSAFAFVDDAGIIERLTYADVSRRAARWASLLTENGVRPGDRVLVLGGRRVEWPSALLGVMKAGAVAVPCPASLGAEEVEARAADSEAVVVVSIGARGAPELVLPGIDGEDDRAALEAQPSAAPTFVTDGDEPALILYARGRGVVHTHASCRAQAVPAEQWLGVGEGDRVWCTAEPGTTESVLSLLGTWMRGAEWLLHEATPEADGRLELIEQAGVTVLWQTAAEYEGMSAVERPHWYDLSRVHTAVTTGEPLSVEAGDRFLVTFAVPVLAGWGQAETGIVVGEQRGSPSRPGTIGLPLEGIDVTVVDENGKELPRGVEGELAVAGRPPGLFHGYWNAGRETSAVFRKDVYLTGIGASRDEAGHLRLVERQAPAVVSLPERRRREEARRAEERRLREIEERQRAEEETRLAEARAVEERRLRGEEEARRTAERAEQQRLKEDQQTRRGEERRQRREARRAEKAERERLKVEKRVEQERVRREQDETRRAAKEAERTAAATKAQEDAERRLAEQAAAQHAREQRAAEAEAAKAAAAAQERQRKAAEQEAREREAAERQSREEQEAARARAEREAAERRAREEEHARREQEARAQAERQAAEQRRRAEEQARLEQERVAVEARRQEEARARAEREAAARRQAEEEEARRQEEARRVALERERAAAEAEARLRAERAAAEQRQLEEERQRAAAAEEARRREEQARADAEARERREAEERRRAQEQREREENERAAAAASRLEHESKAAARQQREAEERKHAEEQRAQVERVRRREDERLQHQAQRAAKSRRRTEMRLRRSKPAAAPAAPEVVEPEEQDTVHHGLLDRMRAYGISVTPPEGSEPDPADEPDEQQRAS